MLHRVICNPIPCLLLVITIILGGGYASVQAQPASSKPFLVFSTYLGGSTAIPGGTPRTFAQNVACDAQGNVYVTGGTEVSDLPVKNAYQEQPKPGCEMSAFVAKYDPEGKLLWCTYLGGDAHNLGVGVAAMPDGGVVVTGLTTAGPRGPFPTKNAFQTEYKGNADYFVTVFDADGNLQYSTLLGWYDVEGTPGKVFTDNNSNGNNVAVDAAGLVYVTGDTSSYYGFPVTQNNAIQKTLAGETNAFICIINPKQSGADSLLYCSYLGGCCNDKGHSIAVDPQGRLHHRRRLCQFRELSHH